MIGYENFNYLGLKMSILNDCSDIYFTLIFNGLRNALL